MTHVLFNLLKNGLRAIEARDGDDNFLSIELRRGAGTNSIIVTDTGEGIPPEILNYVFIPFVSAQRPGRRHRARPVILPDDYRRCRRHDLVPIQGWCRHHFHH